MITLALLYLTTVMPSDNGVIVYNPLIMPYGYFIEGKACVTEDSTDCVWNATTQGNGTGSSFISYTVAVAPHDVSGSAIYIIEGE